MHDAEHGLGNGQIPRVGAVRVESKLLGTVHPKPETMTVCARERFAQILATAQLSKVKNALHF